MRLDAIEYYILIFLLIRSMHYRQAKSEDHDLSARSPGSQVFSLMRGILTLMLER